MAKKPKLGWKLWAAIAAAAGTVWYVVRPKPKKKNGRVNGAPPSGNGIPAEAEYRQSDFHDRSCGNCAYSQSPPPEPRRSFNAARSPMPTIRCTLWKVDVHPNYICNRWKSRETPGGLA